MGDDSSSGSVRAAPRRARKDPNEAPVFLQKTFQMVDTCPENIGGGAENGDTFIVKDMEAFANLLPKFFKHKNFRSFVRQLNFYGFRKLRTDGALISERPAHWWEFRHEKFMRGKVEWLTQIKRANHYEQSPSDQVEIVDELKNEVSQLKGRIEEMGNTIEHLTGLVETLMRERGGEGLPGMGSGVVIGELDADAEAGAGGVDAESSASGDGAQTKKRRMMVDRLVQPSMVKTQSMEMLEAAFNPDQTVNETELFSQLSLDSTVMNEAADFNDGALERSFSDFKFGDEPDVGSDPNQSEAAFSAAAASAAAGVPSRIDEAAPMAQHAAGYVAQAALGAAFTLMAAQQATQQATQQAAAASEGGALMRTVSNNGIAVQS
mmetsp:Transcript_16072/g.29304  ORF Transcript_16072/g.29304 Transcript_16072/m.29304 type:complete len:378 (+) Transcript_16072:78-1211(+)